MEAQPIPIGYAATAAPYPTASQASPSRNFGTSLEQRLQLSLSLSPRLDASLMNIIATSLEQRRQALDGQFLQEDMTRNYTCCGLTLLDLHALVDHFEESHVVVVDHNTDGGFNTNFGGGFELADDMDLDEDHPRQSPVTPRGFDPHASVLVRRSNSLDTRSPTTSYAPYSTQHGGLMRRQTEGMCASPTVLFSPSATPSPAPSRAHSPDSTMTVTADTTPEMYDSMGLPSRRTSKNSSMAGLDHSSLGDGQLRSKPFKCPKDGCNKSYKQANGLKYHLTHGQCNFAPVDPNSDDCKPYLCQVGCGKRFKNMSGLRYHYLHSGSHGQTGLALLEAGQMPSLNYPTT